MGFNDVFEASAAAELVSEATRVYIAEHRDQLPSMQYLPALSVVRLIRVRFPNLIPHMLPLNPPVEVAAMLAVKQAMEKHRAAPGEDRHLLYLPLPLQGDLRKVSSGQ